MAKDTALARDLVAKLAALQPFSLVASVVYTHDDLVDASEVVDPEIRIEPDDLEHTRQTRAHWTTDATLRVTFEGRQQKNTTADEPNTQIKIDEWLDFVDEIVEHVKELAPNGKKALTISFDERYDRDHLRTNRLFLSTFTVSYSLI